MSGLTQDGALAAAPFFVEERLEEALERALEIAPGIELCLEVHPEVPELVVGLGERLRDRVSAALLARTATEAMGRVRVCATSTPIEAEAARIAVTIDAGDPIELEAAVVSGPARVVPAELVGRRAVVLGAVCPASLAGLLSRLGLAVTVIDDASRAICVSHAPDVAVVELPRAHGLTSEEEVRARFGLGALPLVIATDATLVMAPGSRATSLSRPVRRARLVSALRMVLAPASPPNAPPTDVVGAADLSVLVVDDQPLNRAVILAKLRRMGVRSLDAAAHGLEAIEACRATRYDLVLMDLQMPVVDGLEASRRILAEEHTPRIVALTASTAERDRLECQRAGMRGLLTKPVSDADLVEQLELTSRLTARRSRPRRT